MSVASMLASNTLLSAIPIHTVCTAIRLLRIVKNDIILVQPSTVPVNIAPAILPPSIVLFVEEALGIAYNAVEALWDVIRDEVWTSAMPKPSEEEREMFRKYGWHRGLTIVKLYPAAHTCIAAGCKHNGRVLKKEEKSQAVVYTLTDGVQPAFNIHLICTHCKTTFHNNFAVQGGTRTYYPGIVPDYIQVGEHQFVERKLAAHWISLMFRGWVSATNCSRTYDLTLAGPNVQHMKDFGWQFGTQLTTEHVWDAFTLLTLLDHCRRGRTVLAVPHGGDHENRFTEAMARHNEQVVNFGNNAVNHCCDRCFRQNVRKRSGEVGDVQVIVGDGLSIGRPICGVTHCPKPLSNNRDRFCDDHQDEENYCSVTGCRRDVVPGTKSCDIQQHQGMEKLHYTHVSASATLGERLQRHRQKYHAADVPARDPEVVYTVDAEGAVKVHVGPHAGTIGVSDDVISAAQKQVMSSEAASTISNANVALPADPACEATKSSSGKKLKAKYNTMRSHTEFFVLYACGLIVFHATMLNAEAVSNALVRLRLFFFYPGLFKLRLQVLVQKAFSVPGSVKPEHFIYDSNCDASQQVKAHPEQWEWFADVGMSVDVFHFLTKHAEDHFHCQEFCNPSSFPELLADDKSWFFNSSIAEQNNAWLGGFQSIVRQMTAVKYDFFLNAMVHLHNEVLLAELKVKANARPRCI
ncbi:hypothetical protein MKEN_01298300 [Mycena kentingensis (nom. inval.)]|nr:hypothetical protein MKEN_01298300 [Mycena kentingensis (nom. inval.)]